MMEMLYLWNSSIYTAAAALLNGTCRDHDVLTLRRYDLTSPRRPYWVSPSNDLIYIHKLPLRYLRPHLPVGGDSPEKYKGVCKPSVDLMNRQLTVRRLTDSLNYPVSSRKCVPASQKLHFHFIPNQADQLPVWLSCTNVVILRHHLLTFQLAVFLRKKAK